MTNPAGHLRVYWAAFGVMHQARIAAVAADFDEVVYGAVCGPMDHAVTEALITVMHRAGYDRTAHPKLGRYLGAVRG